jgi:asparagine synthase (glutamine-hydrolysing)
LCGICGVVVAGGSRPAPELLARMRDSLTHRGPDDEGSYQEGGVALGMRRLSIIDVEGGHQPIHNEDRSVWIVFNGEIYNHPDLRRRLEQAGHDFYTRSDTEAVVHA